MKGRQVGSTRGRPCWNCGVIHEPTVCCARNQVAYARGQADRAAGKLFDEDVYPNGTYGAADYAFGYYATDNQVA